MIYPSKSTNYNRGSSQLEDFTPGKYYECVKAHSKAVFREGFLYLCVKDSRKGKALVAPNGDLIYNILSTFKEV